tara:strand:- start:18874 stop:20055 length:1182 start_codon:yes stop_codon:yes gene_type:complete
MKNNLPWTEKYTPKTLAALKGNKEALYKLKQLVLEKRPTFIHGPIGCGKTSSILALASDLGYEVIEINASDVRNKDGIQQIVGNSLQQQSLFHKGKIILVDEVDGISGNKDRGGVPTLVKLITEAKQPIIFTANDPWNSKFSTLRKKTQLVEFTAIDNQEVANYLQEICKKEGVTCAEGILKTIARRTAGDLRAAINDLQQLGDGKKEITTEDLETLSDREREQDIQAALRLIFKSKRAQDVLQAFDRVNINLDEALLWLDENLPQEYKRKDLVKGYRALSKADVFKGRIRRWQHWRFLVYMNALMTAGIALAKEEKTPGFVQYKRTSRILKMWMAKQRRAKKKALAEKMGEGLHGSTRRITQEILPYVRVMLRHNKKETFGLDKEEIMWLLK